MLFIDANAILRYLLKDNIEMAAKVCELLDNAEVNVRHEVIAEVVYVLDKVYLLPRNEIAEGIKIFMSLPNVETQSEELLLFALKTYADTNIDFVDSLLYGLAAIYKHTVFTFDKKLNFMINKLP